MATQEKVTLLRIDTREAVKSIQDLKENIATYKEMLSKAEIGSEQYRLVAQHLAENQTALKDAMYGGVTSMEQLTAAAKGTTESYNGLVRKMADLKKDMRNVDVSTKEGQQAFNNYAQQINEVNTKLKAMDAQQGNYQRNVGNYANSIASISGLFGGAGKAATGALAGINGVTSGLKAMAATPAIAVLTALVSLLSKVKGALKSSESNLKTLTIAFAPFKAIGDASTNMIQSLGTALGKLTTGFTKVIEKLGLVNEKMKERQELAREEYAIIEDTREVNRQNAEDELLSAELRAKANDKITYSAEERLAFLKQSSALEESISQRNYELAEREWKQIAKTNALTQSSTEELNKENDAYIKMINARTNLYRVQRRLNSQITTATKEVATEAQKAANMIADIEDKRWKITIDKAEKGSLEQLRRIRQYYAKELNEASKRKVQIDENGKESLESIEDWSARKLAAEKAYYAAALNYQNACNKESTAGLRLKLAQSKNDTEKSLGLEIQIAQKHYDSLTRLEGESEAEFAIRKQEAGNTLLAKQQELADFQLEQERLAQENRLALMNQNSMDYYNAAIEAKKEEVDRILEEGRRETETEEEYAARRIAAEEEYTEAKKALKDKQVSMLQDVAGGTADIFGSIADLIEESDGENEKSFKATKALRIAEATINTINGAISAYMSAMESYPAPLNVAMGAIQATGVTAAGLAEIAKIKATTFSSSSSSSASSSSLSSTSAATTAPSVYPTITEIQNATNASDLAEINANTSSSQKVYILSSDIEASQTDTKVRVEEATF